MYTFQNERYRLRAARIKFQPLRATRRFQQRKFVDSSIKLKKMMQPEQDDSSINFFQRTPSPSYMCTFKTVDSIIDPRSHSKSRILSYYRRIETDPTSTSVSKTKAGKMDFQLKLLNNKRCNLKQKFRAPLKSHTKMQFDIGCQIDLDFEAFSY